MDYQTEDLVSKLSFMGEPIRCDICHDGVPVRVLGTLLKKETRGDYVYIRFRCAKCTRHITHVILYRVWFAYRPLKPQPENLVSKIVEAKDQNHPVEGRGLG